MTNKMPKGEYIFAFAMILLIFTITIGSVVIANCMLLQEICTNS